MLYLIGLGLWDERDISLRGIEACKECDQVYAELYTERWGGSLEVLGRIIGRPISILDRTALEENSMELIEKARERNIAILVPGDPLFATTHIKLLQEAEEELVKTRVIHSSSIITAVAEAGLNVYNFGRVVSIPMPHEKHHPTMFYDEIVKNKSMGLHTLILLDIEMHVQKGLEVLLEIEEKKKGNIVGGENRIIVVSQIGSGHKKIKYGKAKDFLKEDMPAPAAILIPGKLHFVEEEFLEDFVHDPEKLKDTKTSEEK